VALCAVAPAQTYTNPTFINIPDTGPANVYPSPITVVDGPTSVGLIKVTLHDFSHGVPVGCLIRLQAPNGALMTLMQNSGGTSPVSHLELGFGQPQIASATPPTPLTGSTFLPVGGAGAWGGIAGSNGNGIWRLFISQIVIQIGVGGTIQGGWSLTLGDDKGLVNVDFNATPVSTQVGPGLIGQQGDTWNAVAGHGGAQAALPLLTSYNAPSTVTLAYSGITNTFTSGGTNSFFSTPFANLMRDYLYIASGNTGTVTIGGLTPNMPYDLILYSNPDLNATRFTNFTVNGESKAANSHGSATSFVPGINYVRFPNAAADTGGSITVSVNALPTNTGFDEAEFNGLQIQPAPLTVPGQFCSQALPIGNGTIFFTTVGSTTDGPIEDFGLGDSQIYQDVWFLYTASCTGTANANLCGSSFDTKVAVYNGADCPTVPHTIIAGNDDACGPNGRQSLTSFSCVAGHQYLVRVGGYLTAQGLARLTMTCDGSGCLAADMGTTGGISGRDGQLNNNDFIAFIDAFFNHTVCP
jgi:hypothetical protein